MNTEDLYLTPIIKVIGNRCNLRCGYCFYHNLDQTSGKRMSLKLLVSFMHQHIKLVHGNLSFIWHGGEPLLAGLDFFEEVVRLQKLLVPKDRPVRNSIQTNATLINDEWATFFKNNNFGVGVSLDGDEESHNRFRVTNTGLGTFNNVMRGIRILKEHNIRLSVIQTITQANACRVKENFRFFTDNINLNSFGINPYLDLQESNEHMSGQSLSNDVLTQIMKEYINLWLELDDANLRVREIDANLAGLHKRRACNCSFNGTCHAFYSVNHDGRIYPCDRLSGSDELCFGTLTRNTLKEILHSKKWQSFISMTRKLPSDCVLCKWKNSCNNGCTAHRIGGIDGKYFFCKSRKEVFDHLCARDK